MVGFLAGALDTFLAGFFAALGFAFGFAAAFLGVAFFDIALFSYTLCSEWFFRCKAIFPLHVPAPCFVRRSHTFQFTLCSFVPALRKL